jgi:hypothetical protein
VIDPVKPDPTGVAAARDLERRVEALERANQLLSSTILGGTLRVLDADGNSIATIGMLDGAADGLRLDTAAGTRLFQVDQTNGFVLPWMSTNWRVYEDTSTTHSTEGYGEVTGSTFRRIWRSTSELVFSTEMLFRVILSTPGGTDAEFRVWYFNNGSVLGDVLSVPGGTSATTYEFRFLHGFTMGTGPHHVYLEGRASSGAGAVRAYEPAGIHWGAAMASVSGGWV